MKTQNNDRSPRRKSSYFFSFEKGRPAQPSCHVAARARKRLGLWHFLFICAFIPNVSHTHIKPTCKRNVLTGEKTRARMHSLPVGGPRTVLFLPHNHASQGNSQSSHPLLFLNSSHLSQDMKERLGNGSLCFSAEPMLLCRLTRRRAYRKPSLYPAGSELWRPQRCPSCADGGGRGFLSTDTGLSSCAWLPDTGQVPLLPSVSSSIHVRVRRYRKHLILLGCWENLISAYS